MKKAKCLGCKLNKETTKFPKNFGKKNGLSSFCYKCHYNIFEKPYAKKHPEKIYSKSLKYIKRYPERQKARQILNSAKKTGKIIQEPCFKCGKKESYAHHPDWAKPLEVIWVCPAHHKVLHSK